MAKLYEGLMKINTTDLRHQRCLEWTKGVEKACDSMACAKIVASTTEKAFVHFEAIVNSSHYSCKCRN